MSIDYNSKFSYPLFHAYILEGSPDILKEAVKELSLRILCSRKPPCRRCEICDKVISGNHSDVKTIGGGANVKEIREFLSDLWLSASDGDKKIYIFENADSLSEYSQNTLLLPIEEPPENVFFIICCRFAEKILQTVKSRCVNISFGDGFVADMAKEELCREFCSFLFGKDAASIFSLLDFKKDDRSEFSEFIKYFCGYCRNKIKVFAKEQKYNEASIYLSLLSEAQKWSERSEMNLNMNLTVTGFVFDCRNAVKNY